VKLYRFGKKIFDKIMDSMQPQFPDEAPVNPFDMWQGADFTIKIRKVEGYPNYDASSFKSPAQVAGDDDQLEAIYNKQHDCTEWTDPKNFKTYDELKSRLALVLGESAPRTVRENVSLDTSTPYVAPQASAPAAAAPMAAPAPMATAENTALDEDDTMSYFAKLAADD